MIVVDFVKGKFEIICSKAAMDWAYDLPSRRWSKARGIWTAPVVRLNVEYIKAAEEVTISPSAQPILDNFGKTEEIKLPVNKYQYKTDPMPHQRKGLSKIYPLREFALFCDTGTGKTKIAIDDLSVHFIEGRISKILVICLFSIRRNWKKEIGIHCPVESDIHLLETAKAGIKRYDKWLEEDNGGVKWLIIGIESMRQGGAFDQCKKFVNDKTMMVIDESQNIKNHKAISTERCIELGQDAAIRGIMTGTPLGNGIEDLYSQFQFLNQDIIGIGNFYSFRNRYCVMGGFEGRKIIGYKKQEELMKVLGPYIYQVRKREVLKDLPPRSMTTRIIKPSAEQLKLYKQMKEQMYLEYEKGTLTVKNILGTMLRLSEICGGFVTTEEENKDPFTMEKKPRIYVRHRLKTNPKLLELEKFLDETDSQVVIFSVFREEISMITEMLTKKYGEDQIAQIHGGISPEDRHKYVEDFQAEKIKYLVSNKAGGTGLNMTAADTIVYYSNDFSLLARIQSEGRIERIGQDKPQLYVDMFMEKMIDEKIYEVLVNKADFAEEVRSSFDKGRLIQI